MLLPCVLLHCVSPLFSVTSLSQYWLDEPELTSSGSPAMPGLTTRLLTDKRDFLVKQSRVYSVSRLFKEPDRAARRRPASIIGLKWLQSSLLVFSAGALWVNSIGIGEHIRRGGATVLSDMPRRCTQHTETKGFPETLSCVNTIVHTHTHTHFDTAVTV